MAELVVKIDPETIVDKILDEYCYEGKTLREWADLMAKGKVRPVVRGEWISCTEESADGTKYVGHRCSMCNEWEGFAEDCNFCPNCGADMRQEPPKEADE